MPDNTADKANARTFLGCMGQGVFAGLLAASFSHWFGVPNPFVLSLFLVMSTSSLRGWGEWCALMGLFGTYVTYFAIHDIIKWNSEGTVLKILFVIGALAIFICYITLVISLATRRRKQALDNLSMLSGGTSNRVVMEQAENWEEMYHVKMRLNQANGKSFAGYLIFPIFMAGIGLICAYFFLKTHFLDSIAASITVFYLVLLARLAAYARRLNRSSAREILETDDRRPILFLRPFGFDHLQVNPVGYDRGIMAFISPPMEKRTFEEYLSREFEDLGPLIAIGRPGETVAPIGAAREYADDTSWKDLVLRWSVQSQFVIMEVDATPGMEWELENVSRQVSLQRILIILQPGEELYQPRSNAWYDRWKSLRDQFDFLPEIDEDSVAILFNNENHPEVVSSKTSAVEKRISLIKNAWMSHIIQASKT